MTRVLTQEVYKDFGHRVPEGKGFVAALLESNPPIIEEEFPLHDKEQICDISRMLKRSFIPLKGIDVEKIRNYFGN
jgi:hypothetical protein